MKKLKKSGISLSLTHFLSDKNEFMRIWFSFTFKTSFRTRLSGWRLKAKFLAFLGTCLTEIDSFTFFWQFVFQHGNTIYAFSCDLNNISSCFLFTFSFFFCIMFHIRRLRTQTLENFRIWNKRNSLHLGSNLISNLKIMLLFFLFS